jgi:hypothetical protein
MDQYSPANLGLGYAPPSKDHLFSQRVLNTEEGPLTTSPECPSWIVEFIRKDQFPSLASFERSMRMCRDGCIAIYKLERTYIWDLTRSASRQRCRFGGDSLDSTQVVTTKITS